MKKSSVTTPGIDPGTVRLVAQRDSSKELSENRHILLPQPALQVHKFYKHSFY